jgi:hypothetical protein
VTSGGDSYVVFEPAPPEGLTEVIAMVNIEDAPRLRELCEKASREHDHGKLLDLVRQINELLERKKRTPSGEEPERKALTRRVNLAGGFPMNAFTVSRFLPGPI